MQWTNSYNLRSLWAQGQWAWCRQNNKKVWVCMTAENSVSPAGPMLMLVTYSMFMVYNVESIILPGKEGKEKMWVRVMQWHNNRQKQNHPGLAKLCQRGWMMVQTKYFSHKKIWLTIRPVYYEWKFGFWVDMFIKTNTETESVYISFRLKLYCPFPLHHQTSGVDMQLNCILLMSHLTSSAYFTKPKWAHMDMLSVRIFHRMAVKAELLEGECAKKRS